MFYVERVGGKKEEEKRSILWGCISNFSSCFFLNHVVLTVKSSGTSGQLLNGRSDGTVRMSPLTDGKVKPFHPETGRG